MRIQEPSSFEKLITKKVFKVIVPEVYSGNIPKYYMQEHNGQLPMLNGVRVSWEEYMEANPDYQREESFVPEMIYTPSENNMTTSMVTITVIVDMLDNDVPFSIADPDVNYPEIIRIMEGFLNMAEQYNPTMVELKLFINKVSDALRTFRECYERYKQRTEYRRTGRLPDKETSYDKLVKRFL